MWSVNDGELARVNREAEAAMRRKQTKKEQRKRDALAKLMRPLVAVIRADRLQRQAAAMAPIREATDMPEAGSLILARRLATVIKDIDL